MASSRYDVRLPTKTPGKPRPRGPLFWLVLGSAIASFLAVAAGLLIFCITGGGSSRPDLLAQFPVAEMLPEKAPPPARGDLGSPPVDPPAPPSPPTTPQPVQPLPTPSLPAKNPAAEALPKIEPAPAAEPIILASAKTEKEPDEIAARHRGGAPAQLQAVAKAAVFEYSGDPEIDGAIARGVAYLKEAEDFRLGARALAGLTMLSCGVPDNDRAVLRIAGYVRAGVAQLTATYELALCLLFLDKLGKPQDRERIQHIALQLIAGQGIQGGWNYNSFPLDEKQEKKLLTMLRNPARPATGAYTPRAIPEWENPMMRKGVVIPADLKNLPVMQYHPGQKLRFQNSPWHEDNSLTQFVVLALWKARLHDIPVERSLAMVEARFRASQNPDGTWGYKWDNGKFGGGFRADSMTCAGLLGLAVGHGIRPVRSEEKAPAKQREAAKPTAKKPAKKPENSGGDPAIEKALRYLAKKIGTPGLKEIVVDQVKANAELMQLQAQFAKAAQADRELILQNIQAALKGRDNIMSRGTILGANARGDLYYLWSLERVAVAYDLRTIGGKDWYTWGARLMLAHQQADGSWGDLYPGVPDTCFALLFLKRVNVARDLTANLQRLLLSREAGVRTRDFHSPGGSGAQPSAMAAPKGPPNVAADGRK